MLDFNLEDVEALFLEADSYRTSHERRAEISNILAINVMGWKCHANDPERLWRGTNGQPIEWHLRNGERVILCMHPWVDGVNKLEQFSFSPAHNYHPKWVDWRDIVRTRVNENLP